MTIDAQRRSLLRHGFTFLFLGLWLGIATAVLPNARGWMAAHLTAFFTGLMLSVLAFAWRELHLTDGPAPHRLFSGNSRRLHRPRRRIVWRDRQPARSRLGPRRRDAAHARRDLYGAARGHRPEPAGFVWTGAVRHKGSVEHMKFRIQN
jgi:hypothetical protein